MRGTATALQPFWPIKLSEETPHCNHSSGTKPETATTVSSFNVRTRKSPRIERLDGDNPKFDLYRAMPVKERKKKSLNTWQTLALKVTTVRKRSSNCPQKSKSPNYQYRSNSRRGLKKKKRTPKADNYLSRRVMQTSTADCGKRADASRMVLQLWETISVSRSRQGNSVLCHPEHSVLLSLTRSIRRPMPFFPPPVLSE